MGSNITIPQWAYNEEVVEYIASRYSISPQQVINHFMCQEGILKYRTSAGEREFSFEENEMAILRDMGILPSRIEFAEN